MHFPVLAFLQGLLDSVTYQATSKVYVVAITEHHKTVDGVLVLLLVCLLMDSKLSEGSKGTFSTMHPQYLVLESSGNGHEYLPMSFRPKVGQFLTNHES